MVWHDRILKFSFNYDISLIFVVFFYYKVFKSSFKLWQKTQNSYDPLNIDRVFSGNTKENIQWIR